MANQDVPEWRVGFWFLTTNTGWTRIEFAFLKASNKEAAIAYGIQRAVHLGFRVNKDTRIKAIPEDGSGLL